MQVEVAKQPIRADTLIRSFITRFAGLEEPFKSVFQIEPLAFGNLLQGLLNEVSGAVKARESSMQRVKKEMIDVSHP